MVSFISRHQKASLFPGFYTLFFLFGGSHSWLSLRIGLEHLNNTSSHAPAPKPSEISVRFLNTPRDSHGKPPLRITVFSHRIQSFMKNTHILHPDKFLICLSLSVVFFFLTSLFSAPSPQREYKPREARALSCLSVVSSQTSEQYLEQVTTHFNRVM